MNKFAIHNETKQVFEVLSTRSFNTARGGFKVRCVEYTDTKPIPKDGCRALMKLPIKEFKKYFTFLNSEISKVLYGD